MDSFNLKTASTYINNLLLARGLLRNGTHIEFARPSKGEGGREATLAHIINLVHDMILRRDREQEQRESLAQTLRALRNDANHSTTTIERLEARNEDLSRQLSLSQSQERSAKAALRTAEATVRTLREELIKLKGTVQQIRAACANDVRKRDVQIQRLKSHLTEQQRGNKTGLVGASITISPGLNVANKDKEQRMDDNLDINDPAYSLKHETTEFLTQLSQSLSDENDNLISLVRSALATLKELQGLPENAQRAGETLSPINTDGNDSESNMLQVLPTSYEALSKDMEHVLDSLKAILTNPNYVPIEEVTHRDGEILRLREGWEKIEARWREAILLMDGWRTRMLNGGDTINLEEIKLGLGLAEGIAIETRTTRASDSTDLILEEHTEELEDEGSLEGEANSSSALQHELEVAVDEMQAVKPTNGRTFKPLDPLREADGNRRSPRKVTFDAEPVTDENASEVDLLPSTVLAATKPHKSTYRFHPPTNPSEQKRSLDLSREESPRKTIKHKSLKRLSSPSPLAEERSPKLTVQEKLNVARAEAEAAAVAAGLRLDDIEVEFEDGFGKVGGLKDAGGAGKDGLGVKGGSPIKKTGLRGRPKRRKSTLTPEELDTLMFN